MSFPTNRNPADGSPEGDNVLLRAYTGLVRQALKARFMAEAEKFVEESVTQAMSELAVTIQSFHQGHMRDLVVHIQATYNGKKVP